MVDANEAVQALEWSIRALAQAPETQCALYPNFACVPDELVLEFSEALQRARETRALLPARLAVAIERIENKIDLMTGYDDMSLWEDDALRSSSEWRELRDLAQETLRAVGWSELPPPPNRGAVYVGRPR